jgi:hypothetical protein
VCRASARSRPLLPRGPSTLKRFLDSAPRFRSFSNGRALRPSSLQPQSVEVNGHKRTARTARNQTRQVSEEARGGIGGRGGQRTPWSGALEPGRIRCVAASTCVSTCASRARPARASGSTRIYAGISLCRVGATDARWARRKYVRSQSCGKECRHVWYVALLCSHHHQLARLAARNAVGFPEECRRGERWT